MRKTDRIYGMKVDAILMMDRPFTYQDIGMENERGTASMLRKLCRQGKLKRLTNYCNKPNTYKVTM